MVLEFLGNVGVLRGALGDEMLEQVGHAGLAVVLVTGADHIGDVDSDIGFGGIGEKEDAEAIGEAVLVNAFDAGDVGDAGRQGHG